MTRPLLAAAKRRLAPLGRSLWPSLALLNLLLLPFVLSGIHSGGSDLFYHLAGGRLMFETGRVLDHEAFSFTIPGRHWTNFEWLFECLVYGAVRVAGLPGVVALRAALALATANLFFLWIARRTRGAVLETLAFSLLLLAIYLPRAESVRPHLLSYLFLIVLLFRLERFRRSAAWLDPWVLVLLVLWANGHGLEFPVPLAAIGLFAVSDVAGLLPRDAPAGLWRREAARWGVLAAGAVIALLANPFGPRLLTAALAYAGDTEGIEQIGEWAPLRLAALFDLTPRLDVWSGAGFNYAVLLGALAAARALLRGELLGSGAYALGLALVLYRSRFAPEFLLLAMPFAAEGFAQMRAAGGASGRLARAAAAALAGYLALAGVATAARHVSGGALETLSSLRYPVGAVRFLEQEGLSGNLHCNPTLSGYVTWNLFPRIRVSMDLRVPEPFTPQELWLARGLGYDVPLAEADRRYGIDLLLLERAEPLSARLRADPASPYAVVYVDPDVVLFAHQRVLARPGGQALRLTSLPDMERAEAGLPLAPEQAAAARADAERLARVWPENHFAQRVRLSLLLASGRADEARAGAAALGRAYGVAVYPYLEGLAQRALGRQAEAAEAFREAVRREPGFEPAQRQLAESLAASGRLGAARGAFERSLAERDGRFSASEYALLGRLRALSGRLPAAEDAYERALWQLGEADPLRPDLETELGALALERGDARAALECAEAALALRPRSHQAAFVGARALRLLGRREEAHAALSALLDDPALAADLRAAVERERAR